MSGRIPLIEWRKQVIVYKHEEKVSLYVPKITYYVITLDKDNQFTADKFERDIGESNHQL